MDFEQGVFLHLHIEEGERVIILDPLVLYVYVIMEKDSQHILKTN